MYVSSPGFSKFIVPIIYLFHQKNGYNMAKKINDENEFPGYPESPEGEDIYRHEDEEDYDIEELEEEDFDMDLDVPGSEEDDDMEAIGSEDEENNYYSLDDQEDDDDYEDDL